MGNDRFQDTGGIRSRPHGRRMNVVAVFPAVPQPFGDTAARWFYVLVKELLQRGFRISSLVVSEERREAADEAFRRLEGFGARRPS